MHSKYALALLLEAALLLVFGLVGAHLDTPAQLLVPTTVLLLCFIMGLQNAIVTKISQAEIRTTHMTGVVTDLGLELGRLLYWNGATAPDSVHFVRANRGQALHPQSGAGPVLRRRPSSARWPSSTSASRPRCPSHCCLC